MNESLNASVNTRQIGSRENLLGSASATGLPCPVQ
jgi:hypothetical protein